eukprot:10412662-Alexandrium_andersonii.AAC.1
MASQLCQATVSAAAATASTPAGAAAISQVGSQLPQGAHTVRRALRGVQTTQGALGRPHRLRDFPSSPQ